MIGALLLVLIVVVIVALAMWAGHEPNTPGDRAGDSTGATKTWLG